MWSTLSILNKELNAKKSNKIVTVPLISGSIGQMYTRMHGWSFFDNTGLEIKQLL